MVDGASQVALLAYTCLPVQETEETRVGSLGWEDPLEEGVATPVFLPGESHGQKSLVGYSL